MRPCPNDLLAQHPFQENQLLENIYTNQNVFNKLSCKISNRSAFKLYIYDWRKFSKIKISTVQNDPDPYIFILEHQRWYVWIRFTLLMIFIEYKFALKKYTDFYTRKSLLQDSSWFESSILDASNFY